MALLGPGATRPFTTCMHMQRDRKFTSILRLAITGRYAALTLGMIGDASVGERYVTVDRVGGPHVVLILWQNCKQGPGVAIEDPKGTICGGWLRLASAEAVGLL